MKKIENSAPAVPVAETRIFCAENIVKIILVLIAMLLWSLGAEALDGFQTASLAMAGLIPVAGPMTTAVAEEHAKGLLRNDIDSRIVKIRPSSTPIDQISRMGAARKAASMQVEYYSVDTKSGESTVAEDVAEIEYTGGYAITIPCRDARLFAPSETVLFPSVKLAETEYLVGYVDKVDTALHIIPVNPILLDGDGMIPAMKAGTPIVRMGRAAGELDVQTPQFNSLPQKSGNFCQIFKTQIEQSTLQRIADKEVGWNFSDQEEVAIIDMRLCMEKSFLFGVRTRTRSIEKDEDIWLTGGIWGQAGRQLNYIKGKFGGDTFMELMRQSFTRNAGSTRKVLVGGSELISALSSLPVDRVASPSDEKTVWGMDFHLLTSNFGSLYVIHSEIFDLCGRPADGMVIDPEYLTKYVHIPFSAERLSLKESGQRNSDAVVMTEASCLVLRHPSSHLRIVGE